MYTKQQAQKILNDVSAAMAEIAKKHNLKITKTRLKYGELVDVAVSFSILGGKTKQEITYERYQRQLGLPILGYKFQYHGKTCTTEGLRVGGPYKSLIFKMDGKLYRAPVADLIPLFNAQAVKDMSEANL